MSISDFVHGVDISNYQPDWTPAPNDYFVFIKVTEGQSWVSKSLSDQVKKARDAGLIVGFYHFMWPEFQNNTRISGSPATQVAWFIKNAPIEDGDLLVVDWEHAGSYDSSKPGGYPTKTEIDAFVTELKRLKPNNKVGVYTYRSLWNSSNKKAGDFLWIADYALDGPRISEHWTFLQYTDKPIDQNVANFKTVRELKDWINPPPPPKEEEVELSDETIKKIAVEVAKQVWDLDDVIPAGKTEPNASNEYWKAKTFLPKIYNILVDLKNRK